MGWHPSAIPSTNRWYDFHQRRQPSPLAGQGVDYSREGKDSQSCLLCGGCAKTWWNPVCAMPGKETGPRYCLMGLYFESCKWWMGRRYLDNVVITHEAKNPDLVKSKKLHFNLKRITPDPYNFCVLFHFGENDYILTPTSPKFTWNVLP